MYIDTHTHLYLDKFKEDIDEVIQNGKKLGVNTFILPNVDSTTMDDMLALEAAYPDMCYSLPGLHPCSVKDNYKDELRIVEEMLKSRDYIGVGEIGIDLYWDKSTHDIQLEAYKIQIEWAKERNLPFVIHSRDSLDITINTVEQLQDGNLKGIFHCFNGTEEQAKRIIDLGFYMGIGGVVTFKNAGVDKVVKNIALDHLVLETDAPYLTPAPYRGQRNEPQYIPVIAEKIALLHEVSLSDVAAKTTANTKRLFGI